MGTKDARVDAYIARAGDFAKPILEHLRTRVHIGARRLQRHLARPAPQRGIAARKHRLSESPSPSSARRRAEQREHRGEHPEHRP